MKVSMEDLKKLREKTSAGVSDCRRALIEAKGDFSKAEEYLRKRGLEIAQSKKERVVFQGRIESYVHLGNKIGVLVEINCETDFVAKNEKFIQFAKDIAMQIAAANPQYLKIEDVPKEALKGEKDHEAFYQEHCLIKQKFIKDQNITINDYHNGTIKRYH